MTRPNTAYAVTGLVLLGVSGVIGSRAVEMSFFSFLGPGAGFFPMILSGLLAAMSLVLLIQAVFWPASLPTVSFSAGGIAGHARIGTVLLALLAVAFMVEPLGFRATLAAFFFVMFAVLGRRGLLVSAVAALVLGVAYHFVFKGLLGVPLPSGTFGF